MRKVNQKIKRHQNIYQKSKMKTFSIALGTIVGLFILAFIGWNLYTIAYEMIMEISEKSDSETTSTIEDPLGEFEELESDSNLSTSPNTTPPIADMEGKGRAEKSVYIPSIILHDEQGFNAILDFAIKAGCTEIVLDAKDATGMVLFTSTNDKAVAAGAITGTAFDAKKITKKIANAGLTPVARLNAYKDDYMATFDKDMSVLYYNTSVSWLDNSPELGGRGWLNPYSTESQDYIKSLAIELADSGFKKIIIDSLSFPTGLGLEKAGYGDTSMQTKSEVLATFAEEIEAELHARGILVIVNFPDYFFELEDMFIPTNVMIEVSNDSDTLEYNDVVEAAYKNAKSKLSEDTNIYINIKGLAVDGSPISLSDIDEVSNIAFEMGASGCMFYNPQGSYLLD